MSEDDRVSRVALVFAWLVAGAVYWTVTMLWNAAFSSESKSALSRLVSTLIWMVLFALVLRMIRAYKAKKAG